MGTASLPTFLGLALPPIDSPPHLALLAIAAACLLVAAFGAHAGTALLLYSPTKLTRREKQREHPNGDHGNDLVSDLQAHSREYDFLAWSATLVGVAGSLPPLLTAGEHFGWPIFAGAALFLLFFCVALPIALAKSKPERIVLISAPALRVARWLLRYPVLIPLMALTRWTLRAMRVPDAARTPEEIADEILAAVTDSATENALEDEERHWIENIVELKDLRVSEAMTPRTDIVALEASIDLQDAVQRAIETGHSRYPVYEDKVDHVVGVFYAKDALARLCNGATKPIEVRELMRKPLFVPESMGVSELLQRFKASKLQMAIVLDEYGGTAGVDFDRGHPRGDRRRHERRVRRRRRGADRGHHRAPGGRDLRQDSRRRAERGHGVRDSGESGVRHGGGLGVHQARQDPAAGRARRRRRHRNRDPAVRRPPHTADAGDAARTQPEQAGEW